LKQVLGSPARSGSAKRMEPLPIYVSTKILIIQAKIFGLILAFFQVTLPFYSSVGEAGFKVI
jgi:hypothetical protein